MSSAAQDKAFDLSGFLGTMFTDYQNVPEARNDFGVGNINSILDTQLKTQRLAGQQASQQAYNNTAAATALGERIAKNKQARDQQNKLFENNLAKSNQRKSGGSFSGYSDYYYNYSPQIGGSPYAPTLSYARRQNPEAVRDTVNFRRSQEAARENNKLQRRILEEERRQQQALNRQQNQQQSAMQRRQISSTRDIARIEAEGRLAAAQMGMQGQILGSLFSSFGGIGSGSPNYRYWG